MPPDARVAVYAPLAGDAAAIAAAVEAQGLRAVRCDGVAGFGAALAAPPWLAVLSEEALGPATAAALDAALAEAPAWSALPLIFLVRDPARPPPACVELMARTPPAHLVVLQRPAQPATLATVIHNLVELRRRQFETADLLARLQEGERYQKFLLDELRHRTGNVFAIAQAMVGVSARGHDTVESFRDALTMRLRALAQANSRLTGSTEGSATVAEMLEQHIEPYCARADQFGLYGPVVRLDGHQAFDFALLAHEMATNAAKYGALSSESGRLRVSWRQEADVLRLDWTEADGPPVRPPERTSFGTRLIDQLARRYDGRSELRFEPDGLRWELTLPLAASDPAEARQEACAP